MSSQPAFRLASASVGYSANSARRPDPRFASNESRGAAADSKVQITKLLVVEDDFLVAAEAEVSLRKAGYDVGEVSASAEDALTAAATGEFTFAIMDIRLASRMDGIDCAIELFRRNGLRCVFATAHYDDETRRRAEPAQPLGWLPKPYTAASLLAAVRKALDRLGDSQ